jgi:hypothetical protein
LPLYLILPSSANTFITRWGMDFLTGMPPEPKAGSTSQDHNATKYKSMTESQWVRPPSPTARKQHPFTLVLT